MKRKIVLGSITIAQKARRALSAKGVRARLVKMNEGGCVYGIELPLEEYGVAAAILGELGIPYHDAL